MKLAQNSIWILRAHKAGVVHVVADLVFFEGQPSELERLDGAAKTEFDRPFGFAGNRAHAMSA